MAAAWRASGSIGSRPGCEAAFQSLRRFRLRRSPSSPSSVARRSPGAMARDACCQLAVYLEGLPQTSTEFHEGRLVRRGDAPSARARLDLRARYGLDRRGRARRQRAADRGRPRIRRRALPAEGGPGTRPATPVRPLEAGRATVLPDRTRGRHPFGPACVGPILPGRKPPVRVTLDLERPLANVAGRGGPVLRPVRPAGRRRRGSRKRSWSSGSSHARASAAGGRCRSS